jgi:regulator of protease activity HflC (stomatin/prohibitin superfamily)
VNDADSYIGTVAGYVAAYGAPLTIVGLLILMGFRINQEYERGVVYRLGRLKGVKGPGVIWLIPILERMVRLDIRVVTVTLATQETVTRDGVPVQVNAVLWYKIDDPRLAVNAVHDRDVAVVQAAETSLRDSIGQHTLDDLLKNRMLVNAKLMELLSASAKKWGVEIDAVELRDLDIPEQMQRALAREAEAVREAKARQIKAEGEAVASETLVRAARAISQEPAALEIRRLQTLAEIGAEHNSTVVLTIPTEFTALAAKLGKGSEKGGEKASAAGTGGVTHAADESAASPPEGLAKARWDQAVRLIPSCFRIKCVEPDSGFRSDRSKPIRL